MYTMRKYYYPFISQFDPCRPIREKSYETPPNLYVGFQPYGLPQYPLREALYAGTLWPIFYNPYKSPYKHREEQDEQ
ncbi:spore coat associated protein CotJA [Bacillus solimangrovi]|uniref:Spore coat protein CotJA n=1 Tax=Bacillus solimangrovi TaxID=1305675 RepID=A0A1E5LHD4_9BACI|nr:spore coat associated protein CotJA [Bacillus solimangrovi]OEH93488.1 spore coat protein CotJA [Bacillus solimangrovi]